MCGACLTQNGREIAADGGRPHVADLPTIRYADVFPGRVDPLDDLITRNFYLEFRRTERKDFFTQRIAA